MMAAEYKNDLLTRYALPFAAWEIRLYLNSHPRDRSALKLYDQLTKKTGCIHYASIDLNTESCCDEPTGSALDCMDNAACACTGNLDELLHHACCCECQTGDYCPVHWSWIEGNWPWEHDCSPCAD